MTVEIVDGKDYLSEVKAMIMEYLERLSRDLSFQNVEEELSDPAHKYTPPEGELLVAVDVDNGKVLGMVAYHRHSESRCEMKRLFVRPGARGLHVGDALVAKIVDQATAAGYSEMVLDTVAPLKAAISLYKKHGFEECDAYYDNPFADVIYMRKSM